MKEWTELKRPIIFNFQPSRIRELSTPDELINWENDMKKLVGISVDKSNLSGTCCESESGGVKDDCDED